MSVKGTWDGGPADQTECGAFGHDYGIDGKVCEYCGTPALFKAEEDRAAFVAAGSTRLTPSLRRALVLLGDAPRDEGGVVTTGRTGTYDGQPWLHWRTAYALRRRGLVEVEVIDYEAGYAIRLTDAGAKETDRG